MKNVEKFQELTKMIFASSIAIKKDFEDILKEASGKRKAIDEAYNHNSKAYAEAVENAKKEKESKIAEAKGYYAKDIIKLAQEIKEDEEAEMFRIEKTGLEYIQAVSQLPLTTRELQALNEKYGVSSYWNSRAIAELCEKNGVDASTIGIRPSFDTRIDIIDEIVGGFLDYLEIASQGQKNRPSTAEEIKAIASVSKEVLDRSIEMYSGSSLESNAENVVSKAMLNMKMQRTDVEKGLMLGNILRNNKKNPDILNKLLCEFSLDSTISETASQLSGFDEEIQSFKNGKAKQYKEAERTLRDIKEMTNEAAIEERIECFKDNQFFMDMVKSEAKKTSNNAIITALKLHNGNMASMEQQQHHAGGVDIALVLGVQLPAGHRLDQPGHQQQKYPAAVQGGYGQHIHH